MISYYSSWIQKDSNKEVSCRQYFTLQSSLGNWPMIGPTSFSIQGIISERITHIQDPSISTAATCWTTTATTTTTTADLRTTLPPNLSFRDIFSVFGGSFGNWFSLWLGPNFFFNCSKNTCCFFFSIERQGRHNYMIENNLKGSLRVKNLLWRVFPLFCK